MAGSYLEGPDVAQCSNLLIRSTEGPLKAREFTFVRNVLMLRIILGDFKRAGDVANLKKTAVDGATVGKDNQGVELFVINHKEAASGKRCPVLVDDDLKTDLQLFSRHCAKAKHKDFRFTTHDGKALSPSNMSKAVEAAWATHARVHGIGLPKLTASLSRKLAVSTHRDMDPCREEQTALAFHMAHEVTTTDRDYSKAGRKRVRQAVQHTILRKYKGDFEDVAKRRRVITRREAMARQSTAGSTAGTSTQPEM